MCGELLDNAAIVHGRPEGMMAPTMPNSSPNSPNLREGRGTHPWGVKAGYLGAVSTYIASSRPLKIFYLPRSSCAQCHANLP